MNQQDNVRTHMQALYRVNDLTLKLGLSKSTIWKLTKAKQFPQPTKLTDRITVWTHEDIEEWLNSIGESHE